MSIDLTTLSAREVLSAVYIGYYNRAADAAGIQFWEQVIANTSLDLEAIATDFASQSETQAVHPFFADPATSTPGTFITSLYQNLFNRDPDAAGLEFWSGQLQNAIDGVEGSFSVGEIIVKIIEGAVDVEGGTQDRTTILNKIEVAQDWTDAAEANGGEFDADAMASAKSIIADVTSDAATVAAAKATTDAFFAPAPVEGETILLTSATDVETGTADNDTFNAYIQQNPFAGGISNSLSSADRLDGGEGDDRLYAELTSEFLGVSGGGGADYTDVQPRLKNIEEIDIEARDYGDGSGQEIVVDGKNITDHVEIGSYFSDGDLKIENLTTLTDGGSARNTSEITVTMDHTDNFNTDGDASDLEVLFDNDYLLSGQESEGKAFYFLLDEEADRLDNPDRLNNIDVDGIRFNITNADGSVTMVNIEAPEAQTAGTHQGFVNALQAPLQALIADGTLPAGTTLVLDPTIIDFTFLDDGTRSLDIPAIVLTSGDGSEVTPTGFSRVEEAIGEYDVYGRFNAEFGVEDQPISIDVDVHKVGRGGDGGNLIIGGKSDNTQPGIADGIEVFNIDVLGAGSEDPAGAPAKPSSLGTVTSTGDELKTVIINTASEFVAGETHASLEIRDGFNAVGSSVENGDLQLVNADGFLGDLYLGTSEAIINLDTLTAQGGGDVTFNGNLDGSETNQAYSYTTAGGDDTVNLTVDGDALDFADSSVNVSTGAGDDSVNIAFAFDAEDDSNQQLNQAILDNVMVDSGAGDDVVAVDGVGIANIMAGSGDDFVNTSGAAFSADPALDPATNAVWAFNFDNIRADAQDADFVASLTGAAGTIAPDNLPGVQTSLAYIGGASITVTLSGAGVTAADYAPGGGVMSQGANGAVAFDDGYESTVTIDSLINGNDFYGDQRDINAAIMEAINDDPVLSKLLTVSISSNNTLLVASNTSGAFDATDLRIEIEQADRTDWTAVEDEAQAINSDSTVTVTTLAEADDAATTIDGAAEANDWYDGLTNVADGAAGNQADDNLHTDGEAEATENDNVIDAGAGNDLIVLSTDAVEALPTALTLSSNNRLINGASNETVVLTGANFGDDTVMNFTDDETEAGVDFLDFTSYLTSQQSASGSSVSEITTPVTLSADTDATANEVIVASYDEDNTADTNTFDSLSAADIAALYNDDTSIDNLVGGSFEQDEAATVVNGMGKAVLMVENANNEGEYKVFELTWDAEVGSGDDDMSVSLLGSLDFGDSLTLTDVNLVGSAANDGLDLTV